jgi:photosystem II stability/assembly factor-like uncharacterized protein
MKKLIYIFVISSFVLNMANAQNWKVLNSGTSVNLFSVYFPAAATGYVAGDSSTILKTSNGGTTWVRQTIMVPNYTYYSIFFTDTLNGCVTGIPGDVIITSNGGNPWHEGIVDGYSYSLNSLYFTNESTGYVVGSATPDSGGLIRKSTISGDGWPFDTVIGPSSLESVFFPSAKTGYAVGDSGTVIKTVDGGVHFVVLPSGYRMNLYSVYFTDTVTGYAVGDSGTILKTVDGGTNWVKQVSGTSSRLKSVFFADANIGYAAGWNGTILATTNGGTDWTSEFSGTSYCLNSVFFTDVLTGYIAGDSGIILKTTNGGGVGIDEVSLSSEPLKIYPTPSSTRVTIETSSTLSGSQLSIMDLNGQEIMTCQISQPKTQIDVSKLPSGVYFVKIQTGNYTEVKKLVVE